MKFMLLSYSTPQIVELLSAAERNAVREHVARLREELAGRGELVGAEELAHPSNTTTVRAVGGVPVASVGVAEPDDEAVVGVVTVEVDSLSRAVEIAVSWPGARYGRVEVRPVMTEAGLEM